MSEEPKDASGQDELERALRAGDGERARPAATGDGKDPVPGDGDEDDGSESVWRYAMASRVHLVVDVADYFEIMRRAMMVARQRIFLIGWDFDTRILLERGRRWWQVSGRKERYPARLGAFFPWLARHHRKVDIRLLKWNFSLIKSLMRGTMILDLIRWQLRERITIKFDSAHPVGCSHHQKIVVIDDNFAACGGIDMTSERWDTPEHLPNDPRRRKPASRKLYEPWHDVTMLLEGEVAGVLGELGRDRWEVAGGEPFEACAPQVETAWPSGIVADFNQVEVGIARTRAKYRDCPQVTEIEALFVEHIRRAKRFVYAETQYFASRRIAEVICERLMEDDPPEFCIINPVTADGWLEQVAMDTARVELVRTIERLDDKGRFHIFTPLASDGTPIYVHAKVTIIDDEVLRVGSANMNNRSMGLDSECDVFLDVRRPANGHIGPAITDIRHGLLAEHCGIPVESVIAGLAEHGSMAAMIEATRPAGKRLEPLRLQRLSETEKALADNSLLDPERPGEPIARRGLFKRRGILRRVHLMQSLKRRMSR